jgi:hypothetical protein
MAVPLALAAAGTCAQERSLPMADAVQLTRTWAENAFAEAPAAVERDRLVIVHEDEPGDTKVDTCGACAKALTTNRHARGTSHARMGLLLSIRP